MYYRNEVLVPETQMDPPPPSSPTPPPSPTPEPPSSPPQCPPAPAPTSESDPEGGFIVISSDEEGRDGDDERERDNLASQQYRKAFKRKSFLKNTRLLMTRRVLLEDDSDFKERKHESTGN